MASPRRAQAERLRELRRTHRRRETALVRRRAFLLFGLFVALLVAAFLALRFTPLAQFLERERLIAILAELREAWWSPLLLLALYAALCPLGMPTTPLMAAGAVVFGFGWGSLYNYLGSLAGAATSYFLARLLGRDLVLHLGGARLQRLDQVLDRHGFWSLVRLRFLPIPFPVVNFGAALVGVSPPLFLATVALGMLLPTPIWTYFWSALLGAAAGEASNAGGTVAVALVLSLALTFLPRLWVWAQRRKVLRQVARKTEEHLREDADNDPPPAA